MEHLHRRRWLARLLGIGTAAVACSTAVMADTAWPGRPITLVVASSAGSGTDLLARELAQRLATELKQPVVVDNKPGGSGVIGTQAVVRAPADGYTLLYTTGSNTVMAPALMKSLPYDVERDLVPVASLGETDFLLVANPKTGFKTLQDFVTAARAQPGRYNYASAGNGTALQFSMEQLKQKAGIHVTHIPYRGGPLGMADVIAGQVDVMFIAVTPALPHVRDGRLVALASGGAARHVLLPTVPTVAETYQGFQAGTWFGLFAPVNTPQAVVDALAAEADRVLANPTARAELAAQGVQTTGYTQTRFRNQVQAESRRYALLAKQVGIKDD